MNVLSKLMTLLILAVALSSCINVNDEVWIDADGSGRYESTTNMSNLLPFMAMGMQQELEKSEEEGGMQEDNPMLAIMQMAMAGEAVDTTFSFREMMDESLAKEGRSWEMLMDSIEQAPLDGDMTEAQRESVAGIFQTISDMDMRMQVDQDASLFKMTNIRKFTDLTEMSSLGDGMMEMMEMMGDESGAGSPMGDGMDSAMEQLFGGQTLLDIEGGELRIRRSGIDLSSLGEEMEQNMAMFRMFLGDDPYRMTIHFPGKVKKISSDLVKKIDKNTVMLEIPLDDLLDPELNLDATVKFKGLKK